MIAAAITVAGISFVTASITGLATGLWLDLIRGRFG